jgi:hypothetical protein
MKDEAERMWSDADLMRVSRSLRVLINGGAPYDLSIIKEAADALADAAAALKAERESCAKVAESFPVTTSGGAARWNPTPGAIAAAIRGRP